MQRPVQTVMIEALVIGIMNAGLFQTLKMLKIVVPTHILFIICGYNKCNDQFRLL